MYNQVFSGTAVICYSKEYIMKKKPIEEIIAELNTPEGKESARKWTEEFFKRIEDRRQKVLSKEYILWLYNFVSEQKHIDDESALYIYEGIDAENGKIISDFLDYAEELAKEQRVCVVSDESCTFDNEEVDVRILDRYFNCFRMYGQGSITVISLLDEEPKHAYVKMHV